MEMSRILSAVRMGKIFYFALGLSAGRWDPVTNRHGEGKYERG